MPFFTEASMRQENIVSQEMDRCRLPMKFDAHRMREDLLHLAPSDWTEHFVKQNYEGSWSICPLRGTANATHPVMMIYSDPACTEFEDTPFLQKLMYLSGILSSFCCPLLSARLMKLPPGSLIKEHRDYDLAIELGTARIHIPVQTNDLVIFKLNGTRVILNEGECWYLRLRDPHSVENRGKTERIHLVIDVIVNDWLKSHMHHL